MHVLLSAQDLGVRFVGGLLRTGWMAKESQVLGKVVLTGQHVRGRTSVLQASATEAATQK